MYFFRNVQKIFILVLVTLWVLSPTESSAGFLMGRTEALEKAFPRATLIDGENVFLTDEQKEQLRRLSKSPWEDRIVRYFVAYREETLLGYAIINTHRVRTKTETVLMSVSPTGRIERILILSFFEPNEYMATDRWLEQFSGRSLDDGFRIRQDIDVITGATLTSEAMAAQARRVLAFYQVIFQKTPY